MTEQAMSMIERVALAIINSDRAAAGLPHAPSRENIPDSDGYVRNAVAALNAMREPSEEMVRAGAIAASGDYDWRVDPAIPYNECDYRFRAQWEGEASAAWETMIDAALAGRG